MARDAVSPRTYRLRAHSADAKRLDALLALKDYAIKAPLDVGADIIQGINTLDYAYERSEAPTSDTRALLDSVVREGPAADQRPLLEGLIDKDRSKLDQLILLLTRITYPVTIENLSHLANKELLPKFVNKIIWTGISAAILCGVFMAVIRLGGRGASGFEYAELLAEGSKALLALSLGTVGSVVFVMLPDGKLNIFAGLDEETKAMNKLRITMGALLGFVLYVIRPNMFQFLQNPALSALELLFPLLGGYSITLVVGVLAKAVTALELTLNLDEKRTRASLRRRA